MLDLLKTVVLFLSALGVFTTCAQDAPSALPQEGANYSGYTQHEFPNRVLFGDTHVHTSYSPDAGMAGTTLTPDDAYRFARGETVTSSTGIPVRLGRPLDWMVITDHSENLGLPIAIAVMPATPWQWSGVETVTASIWFSISSSIFRKS